MDPIVDLRERRRARLALCVLAAAGVAFGASRLASGTRAPEAPVHASLESRGGADAGSEELSSATAPSTRVVAGAGGEPAASAETSELPAAGGVRAVRGRLLDALGAPLAGVGVGLAAESKARRERARTGPDGTFLLEDLEIPATIVAIDERWATVHAGLVDADVDPRAEIRVIVAPAIDLAGTVIDADGEALAGARVAIDVHGLLVDADATRTWSATSDRDGRFRLARVPALAGMRLRTSADGCVPDERGAPTDATSDIWIELAAAVDARRIVKGLVEHADGRPASAATVLFGSAEARTLSDGRFRVVAADVEAGTPLVAVLRGFQPAVLADFGRDVLAGGPPLEPVRLVLPGPAVTIRGHVLDARGAPQKRCEVSIADGTPIDPSAAGARRPTLESLASTRRSAVMTDRDGRFEIDGLAPRSYRLTAKTAAFPLPIETAQIDAPAHDVLITLPDDPGSRAIRGRVVSVDGRALEGVDVALHVASRSRGSVDAETLPRARTDSDGRFALADVPRTWLDFELSGAAIVPVRRALDPTDAGDDVELRVVERRALRVEVDDVELPPDAVAVAGADGRLDPLWTPDPDAGQARTRVPLAPRRALEATVGQDAKALVYYRGGIEIDRRALALEPSGITSVHWP